MQVIPEGDNRNIHILNTDFAQTMLVGAIGGKHGPKPMIAKDFSFAMCQTSYPMGTFASIYWTSPCSVHESLSEKTEIAAIGPIRPKSMTISKMTFEELAK